MPQANINGQSMHYIDRGEGTAIIFIHPPVMTCLNFQYQLENLSAQFRTIAFDVRGHGHSEPSRKAITYPLIVEDIKQLMDQLKIEKAFLCGYSTGGAVVLEFLLTYPDKASGGIVISGMSEVSDRSLKYKISLGRICSQIGWVDFIALTIAWAQANTKLATIKLLFNDARKGNAANMKQYYQYSLQHNCTAHLGEIKHPVLLVYGEKDKSFHPYAKLLHERLPSSELLFIQNKRHQLPTKANDKLNGLIHQFIQRCSQ